MHGDLLNEGIYGLVSSLFGFVVFLIFVGLIFYWAIKAVIKKDEKLRKEILKPFPYIVGGSILTLFVRNALLDQSDLIVSSIVFLGFFFLGFFSYSITVDHLKKSDSNNEEINHLKGLLVTLFVYLVILILTIR